MKTTGIISYEKAGTYIAYWKKPQKLVDFQFIIVQCMENAFTENK